MRAKIFTEYLARNCIQCTKLGIAAKKVDFAKEKILKKSGFDTIYSYVYTIIK